MAEQILRKLTINRTRLLAAGWMAIAMPVAIGAQNESVSRPQSPTAVQPTTADKRNSM